MSDAPIKIELHIGDYIRDTQGISLLQHGIYQQLMFWYYSTAHPIPDDNSKIYRRLGAVSKIERASIREVLSRFFDLVEGFWTHKRIEQELAEWESKTALARENAKKRWQKPTHDAKSGNESGRVKDRLRHAVSAQKFKKNNKNADAKAYANEAIPHMPTAPHSICSPSALSNTYSGSNAEGGTPSVDNSVDEGNNSKVNGHEIIPDQNRQAWHQTPLGVLTKAQKLGVPIITGEPTDLLKRRVFAKLEADYGGS